MNLGFIGIGNIVSDVITGIGKSKIKYKNIIISPRNKKKALYLKKYFKRVIIAKNNQEVINKEREPEQLLDCEVLRPLGRWSHPWRSCRPQWPRTFQPHRGPWPGERWCGRQYGSSQGRRIHKRYKA